MPPMPDAHVVKSEHVAQIPVTRQNGAASGQSLCAEQVVVGASVGDIDWHSIDLKVRQVASARHTMKRRVPLVLDTIVPR